MLNMSEEEDCDDLPIITVNASANDSGTFDMPSAEELATQRARELECEHELERLRERARADESSQRSARTAPLQHSDSSGSDGEQALAAAVTALSVRARAAAAPAPRAAALWAALVPHLPQAAADLLPRLAAPGLAAPLQRAVQAVAAALAAEPAEWPDDEMLCAAALLCVAVLAQESCSRRTAARALHALLDDRATAAQVSALAHAVLAALPAAQARLQLADALRSGAGAGSDRAAAALTAAAMLDLLPRAAPAAPPAPPAPDLEQVARAAAAWRQCDADARYLCVQLAGRLLAAGGAGGAAGGAGARLLAHLAPPPAAASDAQRPDRLKVLVGASKLKLLFSAKNGDVNRQPRALRDTSNRAMDAKLSEIH